MHNLHLIVIDADTPQEACSNAESFILDFGNENNWRTICGCVSKDNEVHTTGDGRWMPDHDEWNTIEKINKMVTGWTQPDSVTGTDIAADVESGKKKLSEVTGFEIYQLVEFLKHKREIESIDGEFDVLKDTFKDYEYDECGVTANEFEDGENTYVVFVDMHS